MAAPHRNDELQKKKTQLFAEFPVVFLHNFRSLTAENLHLKYSFYCQFCCPLHSAVRGGRTTRPPPSPPTHSYAPAQPRALTCSDCFPKWSVKITNTVLDNEYLTILKTSVRWKTGSPYGDE